MSSRKLLIPVMLISLFGLSSGALANNVEVAFSSTATNNSGSVKTDYHVRVTSDINMTFKQGNLAVVTPGGSVTYAGTPTVQGDNSHELIFEWTNLTINDGDTVAWGVIVTEWIFNAVNIEEEWFTPQNSATDLPIPSLGFGVEQNGEFYLTNNTDFPISFENLSVSIGDERLTVDTMIDAVRVETAPGISGTVDNGGRLLIERYDELLPGMFLQATMVTSVTTADGATNTSQRMLGHEHPVEVPTVSQWGLIVMAALLLSAGTIAIVRRRRRLAA